LKRYHNTNIVFLHLREKKKSKDIKKQMDRYDAIIKSALEGKAPPVAE